MAARSLSGSRWRLVSSPPERAHGSLACSPQMFASSVGWGSGSVRAVLSFRTLTPDDQSNLWHWLHIALWDPPPADVRPIEVLEQPGVRIYAADWGRSTDVGIVAQVDAVDAGACWIRLLPVGVGLASIDAQTPQLGIALLPQYQHKGYGRP